MKKLLIIAALIGMGAGGQVQSPKSTNAAVLDPVQIKRAALVRPPPRPPWRVSKSFMFTLPAGATGVRVYFGGVPGVYSGSALFPAPVSVVTCTNMNPFRPYYFAFVSTGAAGQESPLGTAAATAWLQVSPVSWVDSLGQHFAVKTPMTNPVVTVTAESLLNGMKSTVGVFTNQPVISFTRPARGQEFYFLQ